MFTLKQRDALVERVRRLADEDERVVAGAAVGSLAVDAADRFSDLDLTFAIADDFQVADVLDDWTTTLGTSSMLYSLSTWSVARPCTACSCCRTRSSSTSR